MLQETNLKVLRKKNKSLSERRRREELTKAFKLLQEQVFPEKKKRVAKHLIIYEAIKLINTLKDGLHVEEDKATTNNNIIKTF